ncbi:MAG TPA: hypothetical protein VKE51_11825 [Vicinamibacterales bacterium]|nr:hypothetical protein [Vicinamibacterales bacterium]
MGENFARIAFTRLSETLPDHSVQFYDGYFAQLPPDRYTIEVTHALDGTPARVQPSYTKEQTFTVRAPEFTIDPTTVIQTYPANGSSDIYGQRVPFLVLADPGLPWERRLVPGSTATTDDYPLPWLTLAVFAEEEVYLQGATNSPVTTIQVSDLLEPDPQSKTLKPALPAGWVSPELNGSQCKTILIRGAAFNAVMPLKTDLPYLAHCRAVNSPHEDHLLHSVLLANRLPVADMTTHPPARRRYFAHLVSLEGFADYLGPNPRPIPRKPGTSDLMDVQMVSLCEWTFASMPQSSQSFAALMKNLIASEAATRGALRLPGESGLPTAAQSRIVDGYVALAFVAGSGDETFAWYRGPLSPVVPQALPPVGAPATPVAHATSADALMIYLAEQGLFDTSYAAAWNVGRSLALADAHFAQAINRYLQDARIAVAMLAQRRAMRCFDGEQDPRTLLARDASRQRFTALVGDGLGAQWTEALRRARLGERPVPPPRSGIRMHRPPHADQLWDEPETAAAVSEHVAEQLDPVAEWLANLGLLYPVPFSHLVPDPRLLPVESIRFFYVDPDWIDALKAGACSIAIHGSADAAAFRWLSPHVSAAVVEKTAKRFARRYGNASAGSGRVTTTGVLIRSELVSNWPTLVVTASAKGTHLDVARDDRLSANVRLCLFDGIPDEVALAEPYQGLLFGVEDDGIVPRRVSGNPQQIGQPIAGTFVPPQGGYGAFVKSYCRTAVGGVITVGDLAGDLGRAVGVGGLGGSDFAIQMVQAPERQSFRSAQAMEPK